MTRTAISPMAAAIGGAVIGAAAVAAFAMYDEDTREKVTKSLNGAKKKGLKHLNRLPKLVEMTDSIRENASIKHGVSRLRAKSKKLSKSLSKTKKK